MKRRVFFTTQFEAFHRWPGATGNVRFLAHPHRHVFHVRGEKKVRHNDRDIEFITLKALANDLIRRALETKSTHTWSCERWAEELINELGLDRCEVSEDNENGAVLDAR